MTISTSPTFILKDRSSTSFALTLKVPKEQVQEGVQGGGFDVKGFKKGFTVVVPGARRSGVKEGKAGFVETPSGSVKVCFESWGDPTMLTVAGDSSKCGEIDFDECAGAREGRDIAG